VFDKIVTSRSSRGEPTIVGCSEGGAVEDAAARNGIEGAAAARFCDNVMREVMTSDDVCCLQNDGRGKPGGKGGNHH